MILLTGFEPFGGAPANASWALVQALHGERIAGLAVQAVCLPVDFARSLPTLQAALRRHRPQLVLAVGEVGSRRKLSFERVALNWIDARIPDNAGRQPIDVPVQAGAPAARFSTLPIKAMAAAAEAVGVPAEISLSAGSYLCNQVFFGLQQRLARRPGVRSGFLHVPAQGLDLDDMARGLRAALAVAQGEELRRTDGRLD